MNRVALYARVSTSNGGQNPEMQLVELREYAAKRGWTVVGEFTDHCSGAKDSRPRLDAMMKLAKARKLEVVCIWKLDRFARSLKHLVNALSELEALGCTFVSLRDSLDLTTPGGRLQFQIIGAMAEFERALISERVKAGMAHAKAKGKKLGRHRVDLTKDKDAQFIREARKMKASYGIIAKELGRPVGSVYNIAKALGCEAAPVSSGGRLELI